MSRLRLLDFAICMVMASPLFAQTKSPALETIPRSEDYILRSWSAPQVELVRHACERLPGLRRLVPAIVIWRERFTEAAAA